MDILVTLTSDGAMIVGEDTQITVRTTNPDAIRSVVMNAVDRLRYTVGKHINGYVVGRWSEDFSFVEKFSESIDNPHYVGSVMTLDN